MSTTAASRPVTRLRSRELSAKTVPEKQRRNKRVVAINKSLKKINISTRGKSLRVSKGNKSLRNSQVLSLRLRPRQNRKNYCEDSKLLQQHISSKQHDSVVVLEKLHVEDDKKVPVYKAVKPERPSEKPLENKDDVYDFKFDINDKREKAVKKNQRKKATNKGKGKTIKKTTQKKSAARPKAIGRKVIKSSKPDANLCVEIAQSSSPLKLVAPTKEGNKKDMKRIETSEVDTDMPLPNESINENIEEVIEPPRTDIAEKTLSDTFVEQSKKENANKPRVISIENANNIIVKAPSCGSPWPFRPKNIFDNKTSLKEHDSVLKNSLLIKTLSPILKTTNTLDFGSPWRPPALTFSQTKHFIQSTPYKHYETCKENKEVNKKSMEIIKENVEMDKENMSMNKENKVQKNKESKKEIIKENVEMDKENMSMNKENKVQKNKESKKKTVSSRKMHAIKRKLPVSENQPPKTIRAVTKKPVAQPTPARVSLGEIKNLLQRPNVNEDNKSTIDEEPAEVDKSHVEQKDKKFADFLNFSDTFDVMSETERLSTIGNGGPLFVDLEPTHFSKPPRHSYRRKRIVKFDFSEEDVEEEIENVKQPRKKKPTKSEKEQEKRINEWVKTVNTTFQEIEEYDLVIE